MERGSEIHRHWEPVQLCQEMKQCSELIHVPTTKQRLAWEAKVISVLQEVHFQSQENKVFQLFLFQRLLHCSFISQKACLLSYGIQYVAHTHRQHFLV